jgi:four helix bundle protein
VKTPNSKLQTPGKLQASSLNYDRGASANTYAEVRAEPWCLNEGENGENSNLHPFDLEERSARFGEALVRFTKKIPRDPSNNRIIDQLVGCGTSIGANYVEASESVSRKDFRFSISRSVKEAKETKFFLRMVAASEPSLVEKARELYREAQELHYIFASIFRKGKQ